MYWKQLLKSFDYKRIIVLSHTNVAADEIKDEILKLVGDKIHKQVERTRTEESSPKNTTLYFSLLLETKDLLKATMSLLEEYHNAHDSSVKPATITRGEDE